MLSSCMAQRVHHLIMFLSLFLSILLSLWICVHVCAAMLCGRNYLLDQFDVPARRFRGSVRGVVYGKLWRQIYRA